jgi:tetratricopeptide (TPR) repeat protein
LLLVSLLAGCAGTGVAPAPDGRADVKRRTDIRLELATAYFTGGQTEIALQELNRALELSPRRADVLGLRGLVLMQLGDTERASQNLRDALRIEQEVIREPVGSQDQVWAAYGGLNRIDFERDGSFAVTPLILGRERRDELEGSLMLFFTGLSRFAMTMAKKQIANMDAKERNLHRMREMVDEAQTIITSPRRPMLELGTLLLEAWRLPAHQWIAGLYAENGLEGAVELH